MLFILILQCIASQKEPTYLMNRLKTLATPCESKWIAQLSNVHLNSSSIDELGNWCLLGWHWGPEHFRPGQGGTHGNPMSGNHPCRQLPTGTIRLKPDKWKILT